jgi:curli production assembly/transport component CsgG
MVSLMLAAALLGGCNSIGVNDTLAQPPVVTPPSQTRLYLENLPPPARKIDVALYSFPDLTGQNKPNENYADYSRAVTQGGAAFVMDALGRAGNGQWFAVVERNGLQNLLQERQLIRATRQEFDGPKAAPLPPIRFAGLILEGGILGYDANQLTGGAGARWLGIGGDVRYRRDVVTVGMRLVSVQSGEQLISITTTKTIYSLAVSASAYRFVSLNKLLEAEAGFTRNEPTQFAVRQTIDLGVYSLIMEGARKGLWTFKDKAAQQKLILEYLERDRPGLSFPEAPSADGSKPATAPDDAVAAEPAATEPKS